MAGSGDGDPVLLELFRAELDTHLPVLGEGLLALEKDADQPRRLEAMMRAAHSIKGAARIVGMAAVVRVAHALEDCFVAAQKGAVRLDATGVDVLLRGVDLLPRIAEPVAGAGTPAEGAVEEIVRGIAAVREGRPPSPNPPAPVHAPTAASKVVLPVRDLNPAGGDELRRQLLACRAGGATSYRLDLAEVREVDPAALALLALFARAPCRDGSPPRLQVAGASPGFRRLLRLTQLDRLYALAAGEEDDCADQ
jgi:chemotaxis protein histidine kinase CheA